MAAIMQNLCVKRPMDWPPQCPDHWESLGCAGEDVTQRATLPLSIQDLGENKKMQENIA